MKFKNVYIRNVGNDKSDDKKSNIKSMVVPYFVLLGWQEEPLSTLLIFIGFLPLADIVIYYFLNSSAETWIWFIPE